MLLLLVARQGDSGIVTALCAAGAFFTYYPKLETKVEKGRGGKEEMGRGEMKRQEEGGG